MAVHSRYAGSLTGRERPWGEDEIIVTKTDPKGLITYGNDVFLRVSELTEQDVLGQPHNIIRHPEMPRCIFKLLWDRLAEKKEIFAFVKNRAKSGDHYWVLAHVTPSFDAQMAVVGYHSNRRKPTKAQIAAIEPIYQKLLAEERRQKSPREALQASMALLMTTIDETGMTYDEFIFSL